MEMRKNGGKGYGRLWNFKLSFKEYEFCNNIKI